jgi:uncharacterized RDD family membrane protein YckC
VNAPETLPVYVGFWVRCAATVIDTLCLLALTTPLAIVMGRDSGSWRVDGFVHAMRLPTARDLSAWMTSRSPPDSPTAVLISYGLPALVVLAFWRFKHATPGKMMFSAVILDAQTLRPASTRQLLIRYLAYFLAAMPLGLGLLWVAFDRRKQGWHDKLAGTLVIRR